MPANSLRSRYINAQIWRVVLSEFVSFGGYYR